MSNESASVDDALDYFWKGFTPTVETIWTSLCAAESLGIDISGAPTGSICRIGQDGTTFHMLDEEGYPI